jgi:hypothetical protein
MNRSVLGLSLAVSAAFGGIVWWSLKQKDETERTPAGTAWQSIAEPKTVTILAKIDEPSFFTRLGGPVAILGPEKQAWKSWLRQRGVNPLTGAPA